MPVGLSKKCQGPSWILRAPSRWNIWEEYLQSKPGEFTPDQIVAEIAQNGLKIDSTVARFSRCLTGTPPPDWLQCNFEQ